MFDKIEFLLTEAFTALRRNGLMSFAAITTAAASLFLLGGLGYMYFLVSSFTTNVSGKFEMNVFMKMDLPRDQAITAADKIKQMPGVRSVELFPKEKAWNDWQKKFGPGSGEGLDNPLPDTLHVMLADPTKADGLAVQIQLMPEVFQPNGTEYSKDAQRIIDELMVVVRWLGGALGSLLLVTAGILIYNAIRLTVIARRREIRIMQLVGASYFTIWTPFVIEGMIQGIAGGALAGFLLYGAYTAVVYFIKQNILQVTPTPFPLGTILIVLASAGAGYGFLCSSFAVREPLRQGAANPR